jgi:hypothetical protein
MKKDKKMKLYIIILKDGSVIKGIGKNMAEVMIKHGHYGIENLKEWWCENV